MIMEILKFTTVTHEPFISPLSRVYFVSNTSLGTPTVSHVNIAAICSATFLHLQLCPKHKMAVDDCPRSAQHLRTAPPVHDRAIVESKTIFVHVLSREADCRGRLNLSTGRYFVTSAPGSRSL